ncbi:oligosaccharide flippase family protein [Enterococcus avium]|uniref:oligosaccharide flippase family protein n=1 Tax=Enterococcus avium TaxID=33945 RepID=UPI0035CBE297
MKIAKNLFYNASYQILLVLLPLVTVPYVSRVLGPEGIGINSYTNSIASFFMILGSLGIDKYGTRQIAYLIGEKKDVSKTFTEIILLKFVTIGSILLCYFIYCFSVTNYRQYLLAQSLLIIAAAIDISWFFMGMEDFKKTVLRNTLVKLISALLIFIFVRKPDDVQIYIVILTGSIFMGNFTLWPYAKKYFVSFSKTFKGIRKHIRPSLHFFVPQISVSFYLLLNKTMLTWLVSVEAAGFFDNSDKVIRVLLAIATASGTVMLPRVANTFASGDIEKVNRYVTQFFDLVSFISLPIMFGLIAIIPSYSTVLFGSEFDGISNIICLMAPSIWFISLGNVFGIQYLVATKQLKYYTIALLCGEGLNLILNLMFLPKFGVNAAGLNMSVSELTIILIQMYFVRKQVDFSGAFKNIIKYFVASLLMFFTVRFISSFQTVSVISLLILIFVGVLTFMISILIFKPTSLNLVKNLVYKK